MDSPHRIVLIEVGDEDLGCDGTGNFDSWKPRSRPFNWLVKWRSTSLTCATDCAQRRGGASPATRLRSQRGMICTRGNLIDASEGNSWVHPGGRS